MMRLIFLFLFLGLAGCEAIPIQSSGEINTTNHLKATLHTPINASIAFYVDKHKPEQGVNFYGKMKDAANLVSAEFFKEKGELHSDSKFQYLLVIKCNSDWDRVWGKWKSSVTTEILNNQGEVLFTHDAKIASEGGGLYDFNAVFNSFAKSLKEDIIMFLNQQGAERIQLAEAEYSAGVTKSVSIKKLLKNIKPSSSGTGFFIDDSGTVATADHVVNGCLLVEVSHKGKLYNANVTHESKLVDLAVLNTDIPETQKVAISDKDSEAALGKQIFVTGYPLKGILSDYPSLTVGNVSSLGGLKGASGSFMFTAPVQPGNSGGAVVDYSGNLVGIVSSSLNQHMLLEGMGTTSQNTNFAIDLSILKKFLNKNNVTYHTERREDNFENASAKAVEYSSQILCYE